MKILLLGALGQVGQALQAVLPSMGEVLALDRRDIDLADTEELAGALEKTRHTFPAHVIINAAAYTAVDKAEREQDLAHRVNAAAPGILADHARQSGALLVHYSTDYVFDGNKPGPYQETDSPNPQSIYGRTKLAGEDAVLQSGCQALIFRTSWVFSSQGGNFIKTILKLAAERDSLNVVADQFGAPTSAQLIANVTVRAIKAAMAKQMAPGVYHLTPSGCTTWHGLASFALSRAIAQGAVFKLDPAQMMPIPTEAYPLPAKRPKNSRLDTAKLCQALGITLPDWQDDVAAMIDELTQTSLIP
ncbi:MAG: dTDP-4-dehydrorhamnose reductase [Pseudomonadota bacterium]|jgi:dTDP-4-dehydrorhamnose reductase